MVLLPILLPVVFICRHFVSSYCNKDVAEFRSISRVLLGVRDLVVSEEEQSRDSRTDLEFFSASQL